MSGLLGKLRALEAEKPREAVKSKLPDEPFHCLESFPLSLFEGFSEATPELLGRIYGFPFPKNFRKEKLLFLDTETTGLAGGAGTVAFQIGIGYFTDRSFVVEQYLIHHYGEEAAMLSALQRKMRAYSVLVTFNGRSFDAPLLQSRLVMNRLPADCLPALHADVLYPSRRLWKMRLKSCTLAHLEEELLGVHREDDLPGALVPQAYFQYQKDGDFAPMLRILSHNKQDIVSLAQLFFYLCRFVAHPEKVRYDEDLFSLSREMQRQKQKATAQKCYRLLSRGSFRPQAYIALAQTELRDGHTGKAVRLYQAMLRRGDRPVDACIALAKLYEHKLHRPDAALAYTRKALLLLSEPSLNPLGGQANLQNEIQHRYHRLCLKTAQSPISKEDMIP